MFCSRLLLAGVIFHFLLLNCLYRRLGGSLTNLSDRLIQLSADKKEVSIICQIKPFQHNKCHRWYRESTNGDDELLVEGSVEYYSNGEEEITPGHVYIPAHLEDYHVSEPYTTNTCEKPDPDIYTADNFTAFDTREYLTDQLTNLTEKHVPHGSVKYFALRNDTFYILTITDLNPADEGKYFCQYACEYCDSLRTQLQFIVPATQESLILTSVPDAEFVDIGQVVSLTCTVVSRPEAVIRWILVLNHQIVPHIEDKEPTEVKYDNITDLYTVKTKFHFRGGHVASNPMRIYCQVLSPVFTTAIIDHSMPDLIRNEESDNHDHSRKKRNSEAKNVTHDHSSESVTSLGNLYYAFESALGHSQSGVVPIDSQHLTTMIFKRQLYILPTAALDRRWRLALIIISSFILLLPVAIGLIQILCNKSSGVSYSLLGDNSIQDYYRIAEAKSYTLSSSRTSEQAEPIGKP